MEDFHVPDPYLPVFVTFVLIMLLGGSVLASVSANRAALARLNGKSGQFWSIFGTSQVASAVIGLLVAVDHVLQFTLTLFGYLMVWCLDHGWSATGLPDLPHQQGVVQAVAFGIFLTIVWLAARPIMAHLVDDEVTRQAEASDQPAPTACPTA